MTLYTTHDATSIREPLRTTSLTVAKRTAKRRAAPYGNMAGYIRVVAWIGSQWDTVSVWIPSESRWIDDLWCLRQLRESKPRLQAIISADKHYH